ncbi:MAG: flagellar basal body rod C-terminal domain-containing protein [Pseudomonadota bacterium]
MSEAMIEALRAMQADLKKVEIISQNVANQSTPGYRAMQADDASFDLMTQSTARGSADVQTTWSGTAGAIAPTGDRMDIAVTNGAYLEVASGGLDQTLLVRGGTIKINAEGEPMLHGETIVWDTSGDAGGRPVSVPDDAFERTVYLRPLMIADPSALQQVRSGVYAISPDLVVETDESAQVLQGYLEQSNVNSSASMVRMMEVSKHLESVQRTLRTLDDMLGTAINDIDR